MINIIIAEWFIRIAANATTYCNGSYMCQCFDAFYTETKNKKTYK